MTKEKINYVYSQFLIIWFGQLMSSIGSGLTAFALGIYVFQQTGSAVAYSLVLLAAFFPSLILKPIGGTLSDRVNRRFLMIIGDFGSAAGLMFIVIMLSIGIKDLWIIYLGTVASSIFVALQNPAYKASITDLVPQELYSKSSGLTQLAESAKFIISPIIAGFLLHTMSIVGILIVDIFTFLIAIFTVFWVKRSDRQIKTVAIKKNFFNDLYEGFSYLFRNKEIFVLMSLISVIAFFVGLLQSLLGPMILSFANSQVFGTCQTISTIGMLVSSLLVSTIGKFNKKITVLSISLALSGMFFFFLGISTNIIFITCFGFLFFFCLTFVNTSLDVLVRKNIENYIQGRLWSIISLVSQLGMAIAFGVAGYLADNVFNPLLKPNGLLAPSIGKMIGVGAGRGIGLIFMISGFFIIVFAVVIGKLSLFDKLEEARENFQTRSA